MACSTPPPAQVPPSSANGKGSTAAAERNDGDMAGTTERVASEKLVDRRSRTGLPEDNLDQVKNRAAPVPKASSEIYRTVAPATVVIRAGGGFGTGVIVDEAGWILTNHHVIADGATEELNYKATVLLGDLNSATGAMERRRDEYEAYVHKFDKLRDIALLKLTDPPKNLQAVAISKRSPVPGDSVVAIGHAGAGMLWALKSGQISALGKMSETLAALAQFKDDKAGHKAEDKFKKMIESKKLGLVIQSTCNILPGDSGGPLLNDQGELVGLNVLVRRDFKTGGLLGFHVHRDEVSTFAKNKPAKPAPNLPDPWKEGGGDLAYEDADLDGKIDVLTMMGRKPCSFCAPQSRAVFIDADQDSFAGGSVPPLDETYEDKKFDAEV
ncbi:MAG: serine protease, partial [Myxococcota bacterium]